jgi:hypothetical protein
MAAAVSSLEIMAVRFEDAQFLFLEDDRIANTVALCRHNLVKCVRQSVVGV